MGFIIAFCVLFIIMLAFKSSAGEAARSASRILLTVIGIIILLLFLVMCTAVASV